MFSNEILFGNDPEDESIQHFVLYLDMHTYTHTSQSCSSIFYNCKYGMFAFYREYF